MHGFEQVQKDLRFIFNAVPLACLLHLWANRHRLTRRTYSTPDGSKGCILYLLTEILPAGERIDSSATLARFFGCAGKSELELAQDVNYQPARWIIRLWDGAISDELKTRYGDFTHLSEETLTAVLDEAITERLTLEREAQAVERQALMRLHGMVVH